MHLPYSRLFITLLPGVSVGVLLITGTLFFNRFDHVLGTNIDLSPSAIISLTNLHRNRNHLTPLKVNDSLSSAAGRKAEDMIASGYFDHNFNNTNPTWDFILDSGYTFAVAGENLARGFTRSSQVLDAWAQSPPHRAILDSSAYTDIGVAVVPYQEEAGRTDYLIVQIFAAPAPSVATGVSRTWGTPVIVSPTYKAPIMFLSLSIGILILLTVFFIFKRHSEAKSRFKPPPALWHH
jgi:hypothetical protein